ncbi:MAG: serine hydroxymethyltransferase [Deltaproteobacteria bacterium]|nr:serine hydroxymethyltransferase [Deltaproteobacteria bacterium]
MSASAVPSKNAPLSEADPEIYGLIQKETTRQEYGLEMIPSENFVSEAVLEANGSVLTNKYAEGLPGKRYYGGCDVVDQIEEIARERAKQLFGCEFVNVQPHSGAQANQEAYESVIQMGDTIMGLRLDQGGHLTHGHPVNFSGRNYKVVAYGVRESDQQIDPDEVMAMAKEHRPKLIIAGASAYSRHFDFAMFRRVADEVGAILLADIAHYAGLVAAGEYPSPVPHCHLVTTTTHKTLRGPRSGLIMGKQDYAKGVNRSVFPGLQGGPHMQTIAAKAVAFGEALRPEFKTYARQVIENARTLAQELTRHGFKIVTGGTDSHMMLVDLRPVGVTGKEAQHTLDEVGLTLNKNTIPFDPQPPTVCSGVRLGTPAITTRGMGKSEMVTIAGFIRDAIQNRADPAKLRSIADDIRSLSSKFPLYRHRLVS